MPCPIQGSRHPDRSEPNKDAHGFIPVIYSISSWAHWRLQHVSLIQMGWQGVTAARALLRGAHEHAFYIDSAHRGRNRRKMQGLNYLTVRTFWYASMAPWNQMDAFLSGPAGVEREVKGKELLQPRLWSSEPTSTHLSSVGQRRVANASMMHS